MFSLLTNLSHGNFCHHIHVPVGFSVYLRLNLREVPEDEIPLLAPLYSQLPQCHTVGSQDLAPATVLLLIGTLCYRDCP